VDQVDTSPLGGVDEREFEEVVRPLVRGLGLRLSRVMRSRGIIRYRVQYDNGAEAPPEYRHGIRAGIPTLLGARHDPVALNYETVRIKHHLRMGQFQDIHLPVAGKVNLAGIDWKNILYAVAADHQAAVEDAVPDPDGNIVLWVRPSKADVLNGVRDDAIARLMAAQRGDNARPTRPTPDMSPSQRGQRLVEYVRAGLPVLFDAKPRGPSFAQSELSHEDLSDCSLRGVHLGESRLTGVLLEESDLRESRFDNSKLRDVLFSKANMVEVNFNDAQISTCGFNNTTLTGCSFYGAVLEGVSFLGSTIEGSNLMAASLNGCHFRAATIRDSNLEGASLSDADFDHANLRGAELRGTVGMPSSAVGCTIDYETCRESRWSAAEVSAWLDIGAVFLPSEDYPDNIQRLFGPEVPPSITLFFPRTLDFKSKTLVEALLSTFLAHEAPECRSAYEPTEAGGALVRLSGLPVEQLVQVADRLSEFFTRTARAEITLAIEGAVQPAVDRAIEKTLPDVVSRAVAPMAVLQAQLGERIIKHIDSVYAEVERTEIKLSDEVVEALRKLEMEVIESKLDRTGWAWDAAAGKLVRAGGWAVGTGAGGNALWAFLQWASTTM